MSHHEPYIRQCFALARETVARGNHPFGAILVLDGEVVATAANESVVSGDPTRHAEMVLLEAVLPRLSAEARSRAVLYSSTEPCMMCSAAIYWSGISSVVYGCSAKALATAAGDDFLRPCREVFALGARHVAVIGPVLEDEGLPTHMAYWRQQTSDV